MLACCFTGCEKEVITVAGIQNPEVREDQYIVVENFELKQIEDKQYALPYLNDSRTVHKIGVNISSESRTVDGWLEAG